MERAIPIAILLVLLERNQAFLVGRSEDTRRGTKKVEEENDGHVVVSIRKLDITTSFIDFLDAFFDLFTIVLLRRL